MARTTGAARQLLGPLEQQLMAALWKAGAPLAVRQLLGDLNRGRRQAVAYTAVMTVMNRLAQKGRSAPAAPRPQLPPPAGHRGRRRPRGARRGAQVGNVATAQFMNRRGTIPSCCVVGSGYSSRSDEARQRRPQPPTARHRDSLNLALRAAVGAVLALLAYRLAREGTAPFGRSSWIVLPLALLGILAEAGVLAIRPLGAQLAF